jgi:minor histocompatibility antigen H13
MKFPIIGSCVLFGLFAVIKLVPKNWVDLIISIYFSAIGAYTIATLIEPATVRFLSSHLSGSFPNVHVRVLAGAA